MRRAAILALLPALFLFFPSNFALQAQAVSPLWGDLVPGQHRVGFRVMKLRDATRSYNRTAERPRASQLAWPCEGTPEKYSGSTTQRSAPPNSAEDRR